MISVSNKNLTLQGKQQQKNKNSVSFGNGALVSMLSNKTFVSGLEYLNKNPIAEVAFLDVSTMVAPRTAIDYNQNPVYGTETLFREVAPIVFNPFGPGIIAAIMMSRKGYKGITAGKDTVLNLHEVWKTAGGEKFHPEKLSKEEKLGILEKYYDNLFKNTHGIVGSVEENKFIPLSDKARATLSRRAARITLRNIDDKTSKKKAEKYISYLAERFTRETGAANHLRLNVLPSTDHIVKTDIHSLFNDSVSLGRKFIQTLPEKLETDVAEIVKFSKTKTLWATGLSIAGLISLPYINNTITRLRTGKTGYTAYKDFGNQDSTTQEKSGKSRLWKAKAVGMGIIGTIMLATMGAFKKDKGFFIKGGLKNFMNTIELKGKSAHMDLIKLIYGSSLMSRVFFSRDEQEVKNTTLRDSCGFLNWLVLGGFVAKGVAHLADRKNGSFVNKTDILKGKSKNPIIAKLQTAMNWLSNVSLKTHSEMRAMNKHLNLSKTAAAKNMAIHTGAILSGLAWSMFALGIGMPLLNNHMTNKARERQLKQKEKQASKALDVNIQKTTLQPNFFSNASVKNEKSLNDFINQFKN